MSYALLEARAQLKCQGINECSHIKVQRRLFAIDVFLSCHLLTAAIVNREDLKVSAVIGDFDVSISELRQ